MAQRASAHVLVVDDEAQVRATVREALLYEGYAVSEAENGAEALAAITRTVPDVIVLDLWMPVMDGWALRVKLRTEHPEIPVVVLSAMDPRDERLVPLRGDVLVEKPFDLDVLYDAVRRATAKS